MKNIYLLTFLLLVLFSMKARAQDPQLLGTAWYIDFLVINGTTSQKPTGFEGEIYLYNTPTPDFQTFYPLCNYGSANEGIEYTASNFTLENEPIYIGNNCSNPNWENFALLHEIFYYFNMNLANNPFTYTIDNISNYQQLTITNGNGDTAVYNSILLSAPEFEANQLAIFPNPVTDVLTIKNNGLAVSTIEIFNLQGSLVFSTSEISETIDMSNLQNGLYLIKASTENGDFYSKIVKE